ncbi:MAG: ribbon-helix-helix protein, CopG family [Candidatus Obscuribacterales bacterium]|jgi:metal-responsive CopG/Arc/MetJ family transcriptional regulator|nr:ribbon-helix-helix protein, CopG family [Candidatus Obscuribacterales bacterium]
MSYGTKKVLIGLPGRLLANVDLMAKYECRTRSELIREAIRRYYENYQRTASTSTEVQRLENIFSESR